MRISDWSSDVCSSDLNMPKLTKSVVDKSPTRESQYTIWCSELKGFGAFIMPSGTRTYFVDYRNANNVRRSEEHTSELQSLMRISYAVFCLNKKKKNHKKNTTTDRSHIQHKHTQQKSYNQ